MDLEIHNHRFHHGIPVFLFATDVVEMLPGQNIEFAPKRFNVAVLPVIVVVPGGQDELSFKI
jgi:hypothetical protein